MFGGDPDVEHLHHTCHHAWCVNPWHLEPRTATEHKALHLAERNASRRKHVCVNGHSYDDPANVGLNKRTDGTVERYCKACRKRYRQQPHVRARAAAAMRMRRST